MTDSGNDDDFEALLRRVRPRLLQVLARFRIPFADAEDQIQEVLVQYLRKRGSIREPERWLPVALRLQCLMYIRGRRRSRVVAVDEAILDVLSDPMLPSQDRDVLFEYVRETVETLDWRCREILRLRYFEGHDNREIAEEMGYQVSSIDKTAKRCVDKLAKKLGLGRRGGGA